MTLTVTMTDTLTLMPDWYISVIDPYLYKTLTLTLRDPDCDYN